MNAHWRLHLLRRCRKIHLEGVHTPNRFVEVAVDYSHLHGCANGVHVWEEKERGTDGRRCEDGLL